MFLILGLSGRGFDQSFAEQQRMKVLGKAEKDVGEGGRQACFALFSPKEDFIYLLRSRV